MKVTNEQLVQYERDRWQAYFCFNPCVNRPAEVPSPQPEWVRSTNWVPLELGPDALV